MTKNFTFPILLLFAISLLCTTLAGCQVASTVPTLAPVLASPTSVAPTSVPPTSIPPTSPSPTPIPTRTHEPSVQALSLQEIAGDWKSPGTVCAGNPCLLRFKTDETFEIWSLFQGSLDHQIEGGKITISDGIFHLETSGGECPGTTNGYYQFFLTNRDGKPFNLQFKSTQPDECTDREKGLHFTYTFLNP